MKKYIAVLMSVTMIILLAGCGSQNEKSGKVAEDSNEDWSRPEEGNAEQETGEYIEEDIARKSIEEPGGESYLSINKNQMRLTEEESMLTLSLKVDTAAYSNVTRYIKNGSRPPEDAVKTEEMINYFNYDKEVEMEEGHPFGIHTEISPAPFREGKHIGYVRIKTPEVNKDDLAGSNLTFLIDTSGSMESYDKLPLLQKSFSMLTETLDENDRVSIVTYAGSSEVVLDSVSGSEKERIMNAIWNLRAGGSTAGANGIQTAYEIAEKNYIKDGNNRVILATDGDFNVGISDLDGLEALISKKKQSGTYLSVLGFGTGNIRDDIMETLSAKGNGNYSYIESAATAKKVLVEELGSNLYTVAEDVKAQIEFNPDNVNSYRMIGYENRKLRNEDFADDSVDAGEIGAGTDVVLMFEMELKKDMDTSGGNYKYSVDEQGSASKNEYGNELFEVRIRYKEPGKDNSKLVEKPGTYEDYQGKASTDFNFACAVAAFGEVLRNSEYAGSATVNSIKELAEDNIGKDSGGYRSEFINMLSMYGPID